MPSIDDEYILLGSNFLRPQYTIFDYDNGKIGIAKLKVFYHTWSLMAIGLAIILLITLASIIDKQGIYGSNQANVYGDD